MNKIIIGITIFLLSLLLITCPLSDGMPIVQGNITITGLNEYNGKFVILYGRIGHSMNAYQIFGFMEINGNVEDMIFSAKGVKISNGTAKIPLHYIREDSSKLENTNDAYKIEGSFYISSSNILINTKETLNYNYGFSMNDVIASGSIKSGTYTMENANTVIGRDNLVDWKDF